MELGGCMTAQESWFRSAIFMIPMSGCADKPKSTHLQKAMIFPQDWKNQVFRL
jgi:hypothetical protein